MQSFNIAVFIFCDKFEYIQILLFLWAKFQPRITVRLSHFIYRKKCPFTNAFLAMVYCMFCIADGSWCHAKREGVEDRGCWWGKSSHCPPSFHTAWEKAECFVRSLHTNTSTSTAPTDCNHQTNRLWGAVGDGAVALTQELHPVRWFGEGFGEGNARDKVSQGIGSNGETNSVAKLQFYCNW